ncbi:MAG TPA: hypothetical protein VFT22_23910 [Kofleriaceae bacterium]|nr:hypothetical protein [Kofleriaceae bacterium]
MIDLFDECEDTAPARSAVIAGLAAHLPRVIASRGSGDPEQVGRVEAEVAADPARAIRFDAGGAATVIAGGRSYQGGRFEVLRLCELRARALAARVRAGRPAAQRRLWILDGASPATDIGALQATAAPGSLFQVASQFNCLEAPGSFVVPVADYFHDSTQGPRASISAFPATLVRHYAAPAPDGTRFVQRSDGRQIDLLADVCDPGVAAVRSGYLRSSDIAHPAAFARALEDRFESIAVGVHDGAEVVLGADWLGSVEAAPHRTVAQVLTSTIAGGMYGDLEHEAAGDAICRQLQRAAYLGTLLAAAALGKRRVVLTLIGGGVFANPIGTIWNAILWAADQVVPFLHAELSILVNGRNLAAELPPPVLRDAAVARGGDLVRFDRGSAAFATG